jgi:DNA-binding MarR family transcriptional regulator
MVEEEPKDLMVLNAIAKGYKTEEKIAEATGLPLFEVAMIVERLLLRGLIERREKKGLLGRKKVEMGITERGYKELQARRFELEQRWQRLVTLAEQGKRDEFEREAFSLRSWIPLMIFMGIMDIMMWMTMLNMMNLAAQEFMPANVPEGSDIGGDGGGGDYGGEFDPGFDVNI